MSRARTGTASSSPPAAKSCREADHVSGEFWRAGGTPVLPTGQPNLRNGAHRCHLRASIYLIPATSGAVGSCRALERLHAGGPAGASSSRELAVVRHGCCAYLLPFSRTSHPCAEAPLPSYGRGVRTGAFRVPTHLNYPASFASSVIGTDAKALLTGHPFLAASACFWNVASSIFGMRASVFSRIFVMAKPSPCFSNVT